MKWYLPTGCPSSLRSECYTVVTRIKIIFPVAISIAEPPSEAWKEAQDIIWTYFTVAFPHKLKPVLMWSGPMHTRSPTQTDAIAVLQKLLELPWVALVRKLGCCKMSYPFVCYRSVVLFVFWLWWRWSNDSVGRKAGGATWRHQVCNANLRYRLFLRSGIARG